MPWSYGGRDVDPAGRPRRCGGPAGAGPGALRLDRAVADLYGGLYEPSRDQLDRGRAVVARGGRTPEALRSAIADLGEAGFSVVGPSLTTAPKGFPRDHPEIELLRLRHCAAVRCLEVGATLQQIDDARTAVAPLIDWADRHIGPAETRRRRD